MKHNLKICIASGPETGGIVRCKTVRLRERVLRRLFGDTRRVTIIVPGDSVQALSVQEVPEVGSHDCAGECPPGPAYADQGHALPAPD